MRSDVAYAALGVGVLEHRELPTVLLAGDLERDSVCARGVPKPEPVARTNPIRAQIHPIGVERRGTEAYLGAGFPLEIPEDTVDPGTARSAQGSNDLTGIVGDAHGDVAARRFFAQPVGDVGAGRRVRAGGLVRRHRLRTRARVEPVRVSGLEQVGRRSSHRIRELPERRQVVEDPEPAPVRPHDEIAEVLLHHEPVDGRGRQIVDECLPVVAVVERNVHAVLGAQEQEPGPLRVFLNAPGEADYDPMGKSVCFAKRFINLSAAPDNGEIVNQSDS